MPDGSRDGDDDEFPATFTRAQKRDLIAGWWRSTSAANGLSGSSAR